MNLYCESITRDEYGVLLRFMVMDFDASDGRGRDRFSVRLIPACEHQADGFEPGEDYQFSELDDLTNDPPVSLITDAHGTTRYVQPAPESWPPEPNPVTHGRVVVIECKRGHRSADWVTLDSPFTGAPGPCQTLVPTSPGEGWAIRHMPCGAITYILDTIRVPMS